jgi:diacylglycerol O-acyltransferase / wax synthase
MAGLERLSERELGAMETMFLKGDSEVGTRSTVVMFARLEHDVDFETVQRIFERASRVVPAFRRRVTAPVIPISRPYWTIDPDFDIRYHVRRVRVAGTGSEAELMELVESIGQQPIDGARPLWDATAIYGIADGTGALVFRFHHAISDGEGTRDMLTAVFAFEPGDSAEPLPPVPGAEDVTSLNLTRQRIGHLPYDLAYRGALGLRGLAVRTAQVARHPRSTATATVDYVKSLQRTLGHDPAPPSGLLQRRGIRRRYATLDVDFNDLVRAGKAIGVSLNSVYVAAVAGGVSDYHDKLGSPIDALAVAMPVSMRREGDRLDENRFTGAQLTVPARGVDIRERAEHVAARVREVRAEPALDAVSRLAPLLTYVPIWAATALLGNLGQVDLQVSNVAGYPQATYLGPARVTSYYGFGPLAGAAMMAVLNSTVGTCHIGFNIDAAAVTDPELLIACVQDAFAECVALGADAG